MSTQDGVVIRRATEQDLAAIVALLADDDLGSSRESRGDLTPYRRAFDLIDGDRHQLLVVADRAGLVIGTMQLSLLAGLSRRGASRAQIEGVRVAGSERGNALGAALICSPVLSRGQGCAAFMVEGLGCCCGTDGRPGSGSWSTRGQA
jgi:hypothetical protein